MRTSRLSQALLGTAAWLWLAALLLMPRLVFPAGRFICHQRPDRSFVVNGQQLPVCARCTGLYVGAAAAVPLALFLAVPLTARRGRWLLGLAALPTALTWTLEFVVGIPFSNAARFAAAIPLGLAAAWLVFGVLSEARTFQVEPERR